MDKRKFLIWFVAIIAVAVVGDLVGFWELGSYLPTGHEGQ